MLGTSKYGAQRASRCHNSADWREQGAASPVPVGWCYAKGTDLTVPTRLHCVVEGPPHTPLLQLPGPDPTPPTAQPLSLPTWLLSSAVYLPKHKAWWVRIQSTGPGMFQHIWAFNQLTQMFHRHPALLLSPSPWSRSGATCSSSPRWCSARQCRQATSWVRKGIKPSPRAWRRHDTAHILQYLSQNSHISRIPTQLLGVTRFNWWWERSKLKVQSHRNRSGSTVINLYAKEKPRRTSEDLSWRKPSRVK